jgi:STE24 endopeptidase
MVLGLLLAHEVGALPLAWYAGYRLERRYGLSRQTLGGWCGDHLKAAGVGLLLASGGALVVYLSMRWVGASWWAVGGLALAAVVTGLATLAPVILLPLFFRFTPLERPSLVQRLEGLVNRAGTRIVGVYEWALGDKSRRANAALTGVGATRRILISDTMLADYSDDEIEVVLAHELGHHVHHDIWRGIAIESALILLGLGFTDLVVRWIGPRRGLSG